MAGMLLLVRRRNPRRDPAALIDAAILTIGVGLLSWVFLISPNIHLSGLSWLAKSVSIAYPLGDVLLLAGGDPPGGRRGQARTRLLSARRQHRLPARDRLGLQPRAPERHLQPPARL
jgi:hypothetical protein